LRRREPSCSSPKHRQPNQKSGAQESLPFFYTDQHTTRLRTRRRREPEDEAIDWEEKSTNSEEEAGKGGSGDDEPREIFSTGFQQLSQSFELSPSVDDQTVASRRSFVSSFKLLSRSIISLVNFSRQETEEPAFALIPLDKRKGPYAGDDEVPQQNHHHPGDRPGTDAVVMMNDTAREEAIPTQREQVTRSLSLTSFSLILIRKGSSRVSLDLCLWRCHLFR
jgi:hypothetical protein